MHVISLLAPRIVNLATSLTLQNTSRGMWYQQDGLCAVTSTTQVIDGYDDRRELMRIVS